MLRDIEHSAQDYEYLALGYERFVTLPFIFPFTEEETCVISKSIFSEDSKQYSVCIEMPYPAQGSTNSFVPV